MGVNGDGAVAPCENATFCRMTASRAASDDVVELTLIISLSGDVEPAG
jgi:hypothetical protein